MLTGDLSSTTVAQVLLDLAADVATGCLHVLDPAGQTAKAYLRAGRVYAVLAPGSRPELGARLVSSGALGPEALAEAQEAQRTELQGWRLGELLVHLGYVDQPVVEAFVNEQVRESLTAVLPWRNGAWKFRANERTREDVAPPIPVEELLTEIDVRMTAWATIEHTVHGPGAVPVLSAAGTSDRELEVDADAWSLLCKVDGKRTIAELARECGFTLYEAGQVVYALVGAGLLEVEEDGAEASEPVLSDLVPAAIAGRLVSALSGVAVSALSGIASTRGVMTQHDQVELGHRLDLLANDEAVTDPLTRSSEALASLLGPATADDDVFNTPLRRPAVVPVVSVAAEDPKKAERARRAAARRDRDAEELQAAQAELEAARAAEQERRDDLLPVGHVADVVDLNVVREAARIETERVAAEHAETERIETERVAAEHAETERIEAARIETERVAAEHAETERIETARIETERIETEAALAEFAEASRLADERAAADSLAYQEAAAQAHAAAVAELSALMEDESDTYVDETDTHVDETDTYVDQPEDREAQAAAFAELSASASLDLPDPAPAPASASASDIASVRASDIAPTRPSDDEPLPFYSGSQDTDTASLLRELSSLGLDDEPAPAPPVRPPVGRPVQLAPKKKKGLFGRG